MTRDRRDTRHNDGWQRTGQSYSYLLWQSEDEHWIEFPGVDAMGRLAVVHVDLRAAAAEGRS